MKLKKVIIALIILLVLFAIIGVILIGINKQDKQNNNNILNSDNNTQVNPNETQINKKIQEVTNRNNFYTVQTCINKYYAYCIVEGELSAEDYKLYSNVIYNMLDKDYISSQNITVENIAEKIPTINDSVVNVNYMLVSEQSNNISVYFANGTIREKRTGKISNFKIGVKLDTQNKTFSILLEDYINKNYNNLSIGAEINIQVPKNIEKNENNMYDSQEISDEKYAVDLFNRYKDEVLYNKELAYEHLDEEYRNKKYGSFEAFEKYARENTIKNVNMEIKQYQKSEDSNYTQYVCVDQNDNYYIFRESSVMNYSLFLDTYTVDLPEFLEKYNSADNKNKVLLNTQKFFEAIQNEDYKYAYNKLDDTFKNTNFKTLQDFEKYAKETFYSKNTVTSINMEEQGNVYIYNIRITNSENTTQSVTKSFVMQLKEGTDFVMSFSIN